MRKWSDNAKQVFAFVASLLVMGILLTLRLEDQLVLFRDRPKETRYDVGDVSFSGGDTESDTNRTSLIILTYMRSGSSLTGSLFEHQRDVFYVFEPLHSLHKNVGHSCPLLFPHGQSRKLTTQDELDSQTVRTLNSFFECRVRDVDIATLAQGHMNRSIHTLSYRKCLKLNRGVFNILKCLPLLHDNCNNAKVGVVKTIRLPMYVARRMMEHNSQLYVLHLIRDPRPTIRSHVRFGRAKWGNLGNYSQTFCASVSKDIEEAKALTSKYPKRIMRLLYEDLVEHPEDITKRIFAFVGLDYDANTHDHIQSITSERPSEKCSMCISREDWQAASLEWRKQLDFSRAQEIDQSCRNVYRELGYLPVHSERQLQDTSVRLHG